MNDNGAIQTSFAWQSSYESKTKAIAFGDVDNDGDLDLATVNYGLSYDCNIYLNQKDMLPPAFSQYPNNPPYGYIETPIGILNGTIPFKYVLFDHESNPVWAEFQYSMNNNAWKMAEQKPVTDGDDIYNLATSPKGKNYEFKWDTEGLTKESNNVRFWILIHQKKSNIESYKYATIINTTNSFGFGEAPSIPTGFKTSKITMTSVLLSWDENPENQGVLELVKKVTFPRILTFCSSW